MMKISEKDGYKVMFKFLEGFYFKNKDMDSLGSLLGDMNPNVFKNTNSADPAAYDDWVNCVKDLKVAHMLNYETVLLGMQRYLEFYQKSFGFELTNVLNYIKTDTTINDQINNIYTSLE